MVMDPGAGLRCSQSTARRHLRMTVRRSTREADEALVRGLSAERKLAVMGSLIQQAYDLKMAWIKESKPELSDEEVRELVRRQVAGGRS